MRSPITFLTTCCQHFSTIIVVNLPWEEIGSNRHAMSSKIVLSQTVFDIGNLQRWRQFALLMRVHWTFPDHSRVLHGCFTGASRVLHGCFTGVSRVFHGSLTVQNQFFRSLTQFFESLTHSSHGWFTGGSRVVHSWFTGDSRWFTGGSRMVHGCFTACFGLLTDLFHGLWAAVKGDSKQWNWYQEPWNSTKWGNGLQLFSQWFVAKTQLCTASTELWQKLTQVKYVL